MNNTPLEMTPQELDRFLKMCLSLSSEQDRENLLSGILDTALDLCDADAGTLYLLEDDGLHFCRMVTRSMGVRQGGHAAPISLPPVPLDKSYVCSYCVMENSSIFVDDVRTDTRYNFSGSLKYDAQTGYHTQTMLVVPLANDRGDLIGAMQLINAMDENGVTIPFDGKMETLVRAISAQAAISMTNMQYSEQITALMDSLVGALSKAIDERTPYNAKHTENMARFATAFLDWLDRTGSPFRFDADRRRTFLLSVWLHDVGKLVVPLEVMDKETRLGPALAPIRSRFQTMALLDRIALLEGRIPQAEAGDRQRLREEGLQRIEKANTAGFLPDSEIAALDSLAARTYVTAEGTTANWLTDAERTAITIRKGTLTTAERSIMESHATVTSLILERVSFPKQYAQVPFWAAAHHEYLNGKGYPKHLSAPDIPWEVRLLTILDIFDALTAQDRPYKPAAPIGKALGILHSMVEEGSLDGEILALFEESRAWEVNA